MKQYEEYKDSGVEWIGRVPSHWEVMPLKRTLSINNGSDYKHIQVDEGGYPVIGSGGEFARASQYVYDGEVVLLGRKGTIDNPLYFKGKFWTVDTMFYGIPRKNSVGKYLYYQALTIPFNRYATSTALPSMTQADLNNNLFLLPPLPEQHAIAEYLDAKCGEIDARVAKEQKRIELLGELKQSIITQAVTHGLNPNAPLKDSGVEWIGQVPEHWEVMKTSLAFRRIGSGTTPKSSNKEYYEDEGYYWLQTGDLNDGFITDTSKKLTKKAVEECKMKFYPENSIVIAMYGATIGKIGLLKIKTSTNQACCVLGESSKMSSKFSYYLYIAAKSPLLVSAMGGGQPNISQDIIRRLKVPVPPLSEQRAIATYLDEKCAKVDASIAEAERKVALLQELKQSIITEVVTGKRKVC